MTCDDILHIPDFQNVIHLKAGKEGLDKPIRWIYFADCLECIQNKYRIESYIHGGEFVVLTNPQMTEDSPRILKLAAQMAELKIAALGINEGQISPSLLAYCQSIHLPLFELSEKYPLIDLSQIICQRLVWEESARNAAEQLFTSILDAEHLNRESVYAQAAFLGIDLSGSFRVVEFSYEGTEIHKKNPDENPSPGNQRDVFSTVQAIRRIVQSQFSRHFSGNILMELQTGLVLALIPSDKISEKDLKSLLLQIISQVRDDCSLSLTIGVGNSTSYLEDIRLSRNEAAQAVRSARTGRSGETLIFFKNQDLYAFISRISDEKFLDEFVRKQLGRLERADEVNHGELCRTLETFLNHNGSVQESAGALYLHRNTLNHRLGRIREILGVDLDDLETRLKLKLAFLVRNYRSMYR